MLLDTHSVRSDKGLSTRHLLLIFLAGVAVCGVFFSLGFLVGYNERSGRLSPITESVSNPSNPTIPPTFNAPLETESVGPGSAGTSRVSVPPPVANLQANVTPGTQSEQNPAATPGAAPAVTQPPARPARVEKEPEAAPPPSRAGAGVAGFTVQVTAMKTRRDAEAVVRVLKGRGFPVLLVAPESAHLSDRLFRVQVGPYASRDAAEKARVKLTHEGFKPFIRH